MEQTIHPSVVNIDGERVEYKGVEAEKDFNKTSNRTKTSTFNLSCKDILEYKEGGRHTPQLLTDENAAKVIDEQTGVKKSNYKEKIVDMSNNKNKVNWALLDERKVKIYNNLSDSGGGSKILHKCKYEEGEMDLIKYNPKVSKKERNAGLEGFEEKRYLKEGGNFGCKEGSIKALLKEGHTQEEANKIIQNRATNKNTHPTLKPISLNKHVLNLFKTPNNPTIYIPFAGVGSEIIPAIQLGYDVYSSELNEEYYNISIARIEHWCKDCESVVGDTGTIHPSCVNLDGERVEFVDEENPSEKRYKSGYREQDKCFSKFGNNFKGDIKDGRHTPQLLVDSETAKVIDEQTGVKKSKPMSLDNNKSFEGRGTNNKEYKREYNYNDEAGGSKILHKCGYEEGELDIFDIPEKEYLNDKRLDPTEPKRSEEDEFWES
jgi:hypothetical protein